MFTEYKDSQGLDIPTLSKILKRSGEESSNVLVFETPDLETPVAVVEFDLILAFKFLIDALADHGVAMDHYLAKALNESDLTFKGSIMEKFVKFRTSNGIELGEDDEFNKTKNLNVFEMGALCKCRTCLSDYGRT